MQTATKFFYELGLTETSFELIAKECAIPKSLISYHFGNKTKLANEVYSSIMKHKKNYVAEKYFEKYKNYDLQYATAIELRLTLEMFRKDQKAFRFFKGLLNSGFENVISSHTVNFYQMHDKKYNLGINGQEDEISLISCAARGAGSAVVFFYFDGLIKTSYEIFSDYYVKINYRMMNVNENRINEICEKSKIMFKELDFKIEPYFKIV